MSEDEGDVLPDPTGGGARTSRDGEEEYDSAQDSDFNPGGGGTDSYEDEEDVFDSAADIILDVPVPPTTQATNTSSSPPPRQSHRIEDMPKVVTKNVDASEGCKRNGPWHNDEGIIMTPYFMYKHIQSTSAGRKKFLICLVQFLSGSIDNGPGYKIKFNKIENKLTLEMLRLQSRKLHFNEDLGKGLRRGIFDSKKKDEALRMDHKIAVLEITNNKNDYPEQKMNINLPVKCRKIIEQIPVSKEFSAGRDIKDHFTQLTIVLEVDWEDEERPSERLFENIQAPSSSSRTHSRYSTRASARRNAQRQDDSGSLSSASNDVNMDDLSESLSASSISDHSSANSSSRAPRSRNSRTSQRSTASSTQRRNRVFQEQQDMFNQEHESNRQQVNADMTNCYREF